MSNHSGKNRLIVLLYWQFSRTQYALNEVLEERLKQKRSFEKTRQMGFSNQVAGQILRSAF